MSRKTNGNNKNTGSGSLNCSLVLAWLIIIIAFFDFICIHSRGMSGGKH
jgi:hypothetical protein